MASAWTDRYPGVAATLAEADLVLGRDLSGLIEVGPLETLSDTRNQQPALLATSVAILNAARADLPEPAFVAGHSVGEFAACVAAGSLSYRDALRLVEARARLMHEAGERAPGRVAAVLGLEDRAVEAVCDSIDGVEVANFNAPGQVVISGTKCAVDDACKALAEQGARRIVPLLITVAVHSSHMTDAASAFAEEMLGVEVAAPEIPIVGNVTAGVLDSVPSLHEELRQQLTASVRWTESVDTMLDAGVRHFIEVGPGKVLCGLVKRIARGRDGLNVTVESLASPPEIV